MSCDGSCNVLFGEPSWLGLGRHTPGPPQGLPSVTNNKAGRNSKTCLTPTTNSFARRRAGTNSRKSALIFFRASGKTINWSATAALGKDNTASISMARIAELTRPFSAKVSAIGHLTQHVPPRLPLAAPVVADIVRRRAMSRSAGASASRLSSTSESAAPNGVELTYETVEWSPPEGARLSRGDRRPRRRAFAGGEPYRRRCKADHGLLRSKPICSH